MTDEERRFLLEKKEYLEKMFIQLRAEGKTMTAIAAQLGIARSTCYRWDINLCYDVYLKEIELFGKDVTLFGYEPSKTIQ